VSKYLDELTVLNKKPSRTLQSSACDAPLVSLLILYILIFYALSVCLIYTISKFYNFIIFFTNKYYQLFFNLLFLKSMLGNYSNWTNDSIQSK